MRSIKILALLAAAVLVAAAGGASSHREAPFLTGTNLPARRQNHDHGHQAGPER